MATSEKEVVEHILLKSQTRNYRKQQTRQQQPLLLFAMSPDKVWYLSLSFKRYENK